jgi:hypothetical protein
LNKTILVQQTHNMLPPKIHHFIPFTDREMKIINALITYKDYDHASRAIGMKASSLRAVMFRIRQRYDHAREFIRVCEEYQNKLPRKKHYITG